MQIVAKVVVGNVVSQFYDIIIGADASSRNLIIKMHSRELEVVGFGGRHRLHCSNALFTQ